MQTHHSIHRGTGNNLRQSIVNSPRLAGVDLKLDLEKTPGRFPWRADLSSRREVVHRANGKPTAIAGNFLDFLLSTFDKHILSVTLSPDPKTRPKTSPAATSRKASR